VKLPSLVTSNIRTGVQSAGLMFSEWLLTVVLGTTIYAIEIIPHIDISSKPGVCSDALILIVIRCALTGTLSRDLISRSGLRQLVSGAAALRCCWDRGG